MTPDVVKVERCKRLAIDQDLAVRWLQESGNQRQDGRLAGTALTDDRHLLASSNLEADMIESKATISIASRDIVEADRYGAIGRKSLACGLSSYGSGTESSGTIAIRQDLSCDVRGRHILIVEDIVDSGRTLAWLVEELKRRGAASVEIFALLEKPSRREVDVDVRYRGYEIPDEFVVGFGLDYDERFRNLDSIAVLKPEVYQGE